VYRKSYICLVVFISGIFIHLYSSAKECGSEAACTLNTVSKRVRSADRLVPFAFFLMARNFSDFGMVVRGIRDQELSESIAQLISTNW
jgi:hypothetical protein